jgi:hypothetical protein
MIRLPHSASWLIAAAFAVGCSQSSAPADLIQGEIDQGLDAEELAALSVDGDTKSSSAVYVVQMSDDPVVNYEGGTNGLPATKPDSGDKINPNGNAERRYAAHLNRSHDAALAAVGAQDGKIYDYTYALNGFAAVLTPGQAAALASQPGVDSVTQDALHKKTTNNSSEFLGLNDADGGLKADLGLSGEDVIIGVIDTGAWPEHPSFSDQDDNAFRPGNSGRQQRVYSKPKAWYGTCQSGEQWSQDHCNNKLIGARYFLSGFSQAGVITGDYLSARDADGHGTHTASTAGGNAGVAASIGTKDLGVATGIAPRARIAVYKALWNGSQGGGYSSDLAAAIDAAVADGVDVINYSVGSSAQTLLSPDQVAFLFAADAGVFVAASAGNSGPGPNTIGSPAGVPWLMSVGASTQDHALEGSAILGDGQQVIGASMTDGTSLLPLVDAAAAGSELCYPGALDPVVVAGNIVLCKRGDIARVDKSRAVAMAGGAGMIFYNHVDGLSLIADLHSVPSVHISFSDGLKVKQHIIDAGESATAEIVGGDYVHADAPHMAGFSSRGFNGAQADLIKPDITAPGVNILAGATPTPMDNGTPGNLFQIISGTSMSSPHIAGLGALLTEAHRDWSPAMIKSALMTTAYQAGVKKEDGVTDADPFDMGAGHANPNPAVDPGLVFDANIVDYFGFLCGSTQGVDPGLCGLLASWGVPFDASQLNLPSMGISSLAGSETLYRIVTNVTDTDAAYTPSVDAPPGVSVSVWPPTLVVPAGERAFFAVTLSTEPGATYGAWTFGSVTWSDGTHDVRSPIAVVPVELSSPLNAVGSGADGALSFDIAFGFDGDFAALPRGAVAAAEQAGNVVDDPANDINVALGSGTGITVHVVGATPGNDLARFSLFDSDTDGNDDLDLYVFDAWFNYLGGSGSGTSAERVDIPNPVSPYYFVIVHGWQTDGADANYVLSSWDLGADQGNLTVNAPVTATLGDTGTVDVSWTGLTAGTRYLGAVNFETGGSFIDSTLIEIDTH